MTTSPFENDIEDQARALARLAQAPTPSRLGPLVRSHYERVVLTGMGSSHFAALPTWRRLISDGRPAWWVDTTQLLDSPQLITPDTLVVATSQSGASGEIVALLERLRVRAPAALVAITEDEQSPLAQAADCTLPIQSGREATVSTKSYLNTLVAYDLFASLTLGADPDAVSTTIEVIANFVVPTELTELVTVFASPESRLAYVGYEEHAATSLYAGLITKEAAKVPADGYIGGQFRHGPLELAGPGLTAVLFGGTTADDNESLRRLAEDLVSSGSTVVLVGGSSIPGISHIEVPISHSTAQLAHGALVAQHLAVGVARARGITPGSFLYGSKVTTAL
jgi:glutamine---fructose-6-phosphate transaminase (isomerizing)